MIMEKTMKNLVFSLILISLVCAQRTNSKLLSLDFDTNSSVSVDQSDLESSLASTSTTQSTFHDVEEFFRLLNQKLNFSSDLSSQDTDAELRSEDKANESDTSEFEETIEAANTNTTLLVDDSEALDNGFNDTQSEHEAPLNSSSSKVHFQATEFNETENVNDTLDTSSPTDERLISTNLITNDADMLQATISSDIPSNASQAEEQDQDDQSLVTLVNDTAGVDLVPSSTLVNTTTNEESDGNVTLYTFSFPHDKGSEEKFSPLTDSSFIPSETVLYDDTGLPQVCSDAINKVINNNMNIITELRAEKQDLLSALNDTTMNSCPDRPFHRKKLDLTQRTFVTTALELNEEYLLTFHLDAFCKITTNDSISSWMPSSPGSDANPEENVYRSGSMLLLICESPVCHLDLEVAGVAIDDHHDPSDIKSDPAFLPEPEKLVDFLQDASAPVETIDIKGQQSRPSADSPSCLLLPTACDPRCLEHGYCDPDGVCQCLKGYNGRHCTLVGCPGDCNSHGQCKQVDGSNWKCFCDAGYEGDACEVALELSCSDDKDNDGDGLVDCQDPDCCQYEPCKSGQFCSVVINPESIARNKSQAFANCWERVRFLIDSAKGVQNYANPSHFRPGSVCVIHGRAVTESGQALPGVRISHDTEIMTGFTLSRSDGNFDFVANCDTAGVTLKFGKSPFLYHSQLFRVVPQEINFVGDVTLRFQEQVGNLPKAGHCSPHDPEQQRIRILAHSDHCSHNYVETVQLEDSPIDLTYPSTSANLDSILKLQLTNGSVPKTLRYVTLRIDIEGWHFEHKFEADSWLNHTFTWNRTDIFGQHVYSEVVAKVGVEYDYDDCEFPVSEGAWVRFAAHVGGRTDGIMRWSLNLHHRLDVGKGILYFGHGQSFHLARGPKRLVNLTHGNLDDVGDIVGLVHDGINTTFFGDDRCIYQLTQGQEKIKLMTLNATSGSVRYYLAFDKVNRILYASLPLERKVIRIFYEETRDLGNPLLGEGSHNSKLNWISIAGDGRACRKSNNLLCGDGDLAPQAQLAYPKGIDTNKDGELFISDGRTVRKVGRDGVITTVAGSLGSNWQPLSSPCGWSIPSLDFNFQWPTEIRVSPLDESLFVFDVDKVVRVQADGRSVPAFCALLRDRSKEVKEFVANRRGAFFITLLDDSSKTHDVVKVESTGEVDHVLTLNLEQVSGMAIGWNDALLFSSGDKMYHTESIQVENTGKFIKVSWPLTNEAFMFDRDGLHHETRSLLTDSRLLSFIYDQKRRINQIISNRLSVLDVKYVDDGTSSEALAEIWINGRAKNRLRANANGILGSVNSFDGQITRFFYDARGAIVRRVSNDKMSVSHRHGDLGELVAKIGPTGEAMDLTFQRCTNERWNTPPAMKESVADLRIQYDMEEKELPRREDPSQSRLVLVPTKAEMTHIFDNFTRTLSWNHFLSLKSRNYEGIDGIGKHLLVDGNKVMSSERHPRSGIQSVYDDAGKELVKVMQFHVPASRDWIPDPHFSVATESFDKQQRMKKWKWGDLTRLIDHDDFGRIVRVANGGIDTFFEYEDGKMLPNVIRDHDGAIQFRLFHDHNGALYKVNLPSGHGHQFRLIPLIGQFLFEYTMPWSNNSFKIEYTANGDWNKIYRTDGSVMEPGMGNINNADVSLALKRVRHQLEQREVELLSNELKTGAKIIKSSVNWNCLDLYCYDYHVNASMIASNTILTSAKIVVRSDVITKRVIQVNDFVYERSRTSHLIRGLDSDILYLIELDDVGRPRSKTFLVSNTLALHETLTYTNRNQISSRQQTLKTGAITTAYQYTKTGEIMTREGSLVTWKFSYDNNGNFIIADFDVGKTELEYEHGSRVSRIATRNLTVQYDQRGNMKSRHNFTFTYSELDLLVQVNDNKSTALTFVYDDLKRVIMKVKKDGNSEEVFTYFYGYKDKTNLISSIHWSKFGFYNLIYNDLDHLIALETPSGKIRLILTDANGTPEFVLDDQGLPINSFVRSPFGALIREEDESVWCPLGFHGGIEDAISGIVILQGRAYDSHLGQWMTPDLTSIVTGFEDPKVLYPYRFRNNDPINPDALVKARMMTTFEDWLHFFDIKSPLGHHLTANPRPDQPLLRLFTSIEIEQDVELETRGRIWPKLSLSFSSDPQLLGPHVQLGFDKESTLIQTSINPGAGTLEQVLGSFMNGTYLMETTVTGSNTSEIHVFVPGQVDDAQLYNLKGTLDIGDLTISKEEKMIRVTLSRVRLMFWIGSKTKKDAQNVKQLYHFILPET